MDENPGGLSYRNWFFISLLILANILVFGCLILVLFNKVYFG